MARLRSRNAEAGAEVGVVVMPVCGLEAQAVAEGEVGAVFQLSSANRAGIEAGDDPEAAFGLREEAGAAAGSANGGGAQPLAIPCTVTW